MVVPWAIQVNHALGEFSEIVLVSIFCLSFSGHSSFCSVNEVDLIALRTGLCEVMRLDMRNLTVEGDSFCAIRWASSSS